MPVQAMANSDAITIEADGTSATVHKFGATVISWKVDGQEKLFVSSKAILDGTKPIRGAQFGTGTIMEGQHGFARNQIWDLSKESPNTIKCTLKDNETTKSAWNNKFALTWTVTVSKGQLETSFSVYNPDENGKPFAFTALLHTYFDIDDISSVKVTGFEGLAYTDKLLKGSEHKEDRKEATIREEVDRTYISTPNKLILKSKNGMIEIEKSGFKDVVLWNPWVEKSKAMADFEDNEVRLVVHICKY